MSSFSILQIFFQELSHSVRFLSFQTLALSLGRRSFPKCGCKGNDYFLICKYFAIFFRYFFNIFQKRILYLYLLYEAIYFTSHVCCCKRINAYFCRRMELRNINIEERIKSARENFRAGYNCAQSVVLAYRDIMPLDAETAAALSSAFGGGMGRMREVCGAVSGMAFVAGMISPATDPTNMAARKANYALIQKFADEFRAENGSIVCRELLGLVPKAAAPTTEAGGTSTYTASATQKGTSSTSAQNGVLHESPMPSARTEEYYRKRPCEEYVATAARIVGEYLAAH